MMPTARGGSKPNGGSGKPVTLVRTVVARNRPVHPRSSLPASNPYRATRPDAMPTRLRMTWICKNVLVGIPQVIVLDSPLGRGPRHGEHHTETSTGDSGCAGCQPC